MNASRYWRNAVLATLLVAAPLVADPAASWEISVVHDAALAPGLNAMDVRWSGEQTVLLAAARDGVVQVDVRNPVNPSTVIRGGGVRSHAAGTVPSFFASAFLARTPDALVVGSPFYALAWQNKGATGLTQLPFVSAFDLDAFADRAVVLGVAGDATGHWPLEGPTLWSVPMAGGAIEPIKPYPSTRAFRNCDVIFAGAVRFFPDGRFAVASSVEPGVALYDLQRRLIRTWGTDGLGYEDHCTITEEQSHVFGADYPGRVRWINRRQLLDELLPLTEGPLLIIRTPRPGGTAWRAVLLPFDGKPIPIAIPITSSSPYAHLKADLRGSRIVFVMSDQVPEDSPRQAGHLIVARIHQ
jgi:hypothetical protein